MERWSTRWFWVFGLLIGVPALALFILGLRTIDLEREERRRQVTRQQQQIALLADSQISSALSRIEERLPRLAYASSPAFTWVTIDSAGSLVFWKDRMFVSDPGREPEEVRFQISGATQMRVENALAAEAQGEFVTAVQAYRRLARNDKLHAWATLSLTRIQAPNQPSALLSWALRTGTEPFDGLSPSGVPVALIASALAAGSGVPAEPAMLSFLNTTLDHLRSGRWWISLSKRQIEDAQLRTLIRAAGGRSIEEDPRLIEADAVQRVLPSPAALRRDTAIRLFGMSGTAPVLVVLAPRTGYQGWSGGVLSGRGLADFINGVLSPIGRTLQYPMWLSDSNGNTLWGTLGGSQGVPALPLRAVPGWELRAGEPSLADIRFTRWIWYTFVIVVIATLSFGIAVAVRGVKREMQLVRLQGEFTASVTHEFKSPITSIKLVLERIASRHILNTTTLTEYLAAVGREADRLEALVNRLLETHRIQSGQKRYNIEPHRAAAIAETAIAHYRAQADAKHIRVALEVEDPSRESALDRRAIQDSLENLIDNAIKYSPPHTTVDVIVRHDDSELVIAVHDRGIGIDAADLPRIFDRFYRGRLGEAQSVNGTGLGLAIVKAIVKGHGGKVEASSAPGQGSEFRMRIPAGGDECREC